MSDPVSAVPPPTVPSPTGPGSTPGASVTGAVVLVSGAAGGIGAALVAAAVRRGASVVVATDVRAPSDVAAAVAAAGADPVRVDARTLDVGDRDAVLDLVADVTDRHGPVDVCCANAGVGTLVGVVDGPVAAWRRAWDVNVMGQVNLAAAVLPAMRARGRGGLLLTASAAGLLSLPGDAPYAVTKHASVALAEWLALTHGPEGISVTALCPLGVETPLLDHDAVATRFVRASGPAVGPEVAAAVGLDALARAELLALPHPEVAAMEAARVADRPAWLARMRTAVARLGS